MTTAKPTSAGDALVRTNLAREIMSRFAERTGLTAARPQRRYLWTDSFAVCNFLALEHVDLALRLVDDVHRTLGKHREDSGRAGWLSGSEAHPTAAGLRIGKPLPERAPGEPMDDRLEWDRDGQYFHYLTKWMHALDQVAHATGQAMFRDWAREMAGAARRAFVRDGRMYWKMSVDLTRPLVASMGQHDPLDGYITCLQLDLVDEAAHFARLIDAQSLASADPLGIGGLLFDVHRLDIIMREKDVRGGRNLRDAIADAAQLGFETWLGHMDLGSSAENRLAFRELGLAIGLAATAEHQDIRAAIEHFWLDPVHQRAQTWTGHEDINDVMLATALVPDGLLLRAGAPSRGT